VSFEPRSSGAAAAAAAMAAALYVSRSLLLLGARERDGVHGHGQRSACMHDEERVVLGEGGRRGRAFALSLRSRSVPPRERERDELLTKRAAAVPKHRGGWICWTERPPFCPAVCVAVARARRELRRRRRAEAVLSLLFDGKAFVNVCVL
jgi:hypothetical protein